MSEHIHDPTGLPASGRRSGREKKESARSKEAKDEDWVSKLIRVERTAYDRPRRSKTDAPSIYLTDAQSMAYGMEMDAYSSFQASQPMMLPERPASVPNDMETTSPHSPGSKGDRRRGYGRKQESESYYVTSPRSKRLSASNAHERTSNQFFSHADESPSVTPRPSALDLVPYASKVLYEDPMLEMTAQWLGEGSPWSPAYVSASLPSSGAPRLFYPAVLFQGVEYQLFDHVALGTTVEGVPEGIARVTALFEEVGRKYAYCEWYYRRQDVHTHLTLMKNFEEAPRMTSVTTTTSASGAILGVATSAVGSDVSDDSLANNNNNNGGGSSSGANGAIGMNGEKGPTQTRTVLVAAPPRRGRPPKKRRGNIEESLGVLASDKIFDHELWNSPRPYSCVVALSSILAPVFVEHVPSHVQPTTPPPPASQSPGEPMKFIYRRSYDPKTCHMPTCKPRTTTTTNNASTFAAASSSSAGIASNTSHNLNHSAPGPLQANSTSIQTNNTNANSVVSSPSNVSMFAPQNAANAQQTGYQQHYMTQPIPSNRFLGLSPSTHNNGGGGTSPNSHASSPSLPVAPTKASTMPILPLSAQSGGGYNYPSPRSGKTRLQHRGSDQFATSISPFQAPLSSNDWDVETDALSPSSKIRKTTESDPFSAHRHVLSQSADASYQHHQHHLYQQHQPMHHLQQHPQLQFGHHPSAALLDSSSNLSSLNLPNISSLSSPHTDDDIASPGSAHGVSCMSPGHSSASTVSNASAATSTSVYFASLSAGAGAASAGTGSVQQQQQRIVSPSQGSNDASEFAALKARFIQMNDELATMQHKMAQLQETVQALQHQSSFTVSSPLLHPGNVLQQQQNQQNQQNLQQSQQQQQQQAPPPPPPRLIVQSLSSTSPMSGNSNNNVAGMGGNGYVSLPSNTNGSSSPFFHSSQPSHPHHPYQHTAMPIHHMPSLPLPQHLNHLHHLPHLQQQTPPPPLLNNNTPVQISTANFDSLDQETIVPTRELKDDSYESPLGADDFASSSSESVSSALRASALQQLQHHSFAPASMMANTSVGSSEFA